MCHVAHRYLELPSQRLKEDEAPVFLRPRALREIQIGFDAAGFFDAQEACCRGPAPDPEPWYRGIEANRGLIEASSRLASRLRRG